MVGERECIRNFQRVQSELIQAAKDAANMWCDDVLVESQNQYCPVDTGELKGSGKKELESSTASNFKIRLSYDAPHARKVHETPLNYRNGKQWKFLSTPFNNRAQNYQDAIRDSMRKVL